MEENKNNKMKPVIEFNNFSWQYNAQQKQTLKNINLTINEGEKILLCGSSGSGKSTIGHALNGLIPFYYRGEITGSLKIMGKETKDLSLFEISKMVGTVLQDSDGQFVGLTVAEDIAFALENDNVPQIELFERVKKAAGEVNIEDHLKHSPSELSGGQKQRVSMAGVLVEDVPILLFDEPLANLDPASGKQTIELIDDIQKKTGATVIIIEHRLEDAFCRHIDRAVLVDEGELIADMSPDELMCSDLLPRYGIREHLFVSCLKQAGVKLTPDMHPWSIESLSLKDEQKSKIRGWFEAAGKNKEAKEDEILLKAENIEFSYPNGRKAINGININIKKGEMLAIVGKNGAGKSTFAKLICGFENPEKGSLVLNGENLLELSIKERADRIGYCMQNPNQMISKVMITEEVALGLVTRGVSEDEQKQRTANVLKICGLHPFRNWPVSALSFGQKKRVTIASILALDPEIIILDEPTAGQDYRHYTEIMEFLVEMNRLGVTVVMITHDMHLMLEYCDRTLVFADGRIIMDDSPAAVLTNPEIIRAADLKETSLYALAKMCAVNDAAAFVSCFIEGERRARND